MAFIDPYKNSIQRLCAQHNVSRLYAFGSVLTERFSKESDVDLIVAFQPLEFTRYADNYFDFKFALEEALKRRIDLLEEKAIRNPYFKTVVESQREQIYGGSCCITFEAPASCK